MLLEICREVNNFYEVAFEDGAFAIENSVISGLRNTYPVGTYILIERFKRNAGGSLLNSGLYIVKDSLITLENTRDEIWSGRLHLCIFPTDYLALVNEIEEFTHSIAGKQTNIISEHFGAQSYTKATDKDGQIAGWQTVFSKRLNKHKKMFCEVYT